MAILLWPSAGFCHSCKDLVWLWDSASRFGIRIQDGGCTLVFDFVMMLCEICNCGVNFRGGIVWLPHYVTPHMITSPNPSLHIEVLLSCTNE